MNRDRRRAASLRSAPSRRRQARASGAQPAVCTAINRGARRASPAAAAIANPCASALANAPPLVEGQPIKLGASFGIAVYDGNEAEEDVLHRADMAMYEDKRRNADLRASSRA